MAILKKKKGLIKKTVIDIPAIEGIVENAQMSGLGGLIFRIDSMPGVDLDYPKGFRLEKGDHVICAVSGKKIYLDQLVYWNVELQEPYFSYKEAFLKNESLLKDK